MQIANLIKSQISKGNNILLELKKMRETSGVAMNIVYYINDDVEKCRKLINTWQMTSREILINAFDETHRYVSSFEKTMSKKDTGYNFQREFQTEVNNGISVLESICETLELKLKNGGNVEAAKAVGKDVAEKCKKAKINKVVFDRGGYLYHGRVAALADAARAAGLKF